MSKLSAYLSAQKHLFIDGRQTAGGTANGFRSHIRQRYSADPLMFSSMMLDALMEATTKKWEQQPRRDGPDLFRIKGVVLPEFLTRPTQGHVPNPDAPDEGESEEHYEKVSQRYATIEDYYSDGMIKLRKAAQSSARAEQQMRNADEALRRAGGDQAAFLVNVADRFDAGDLPAAAD